MGWWILAIIVVGVACFVAGMFVYRNNAKKFGDLLGKLKNLPDSAKKEVNDVLRKHGLDV